MHTRITPAAGESGLRASASGRASELATLHADDRVGGGCGTQQSEVLLRCRSCDAEARVHVLRGYRQGAALHDHFCGGCFHLAELTPELRENAGRRLRWSDTLIVGGAGLTAFALSSDLLLPGGLPGFGAYQSAGSLLGLFLVFLGLVFRVGPLAIAGMAAATGSMLADLLDLHSTSGFGWKQSAAVIVGILTVIAGLVAHWRARRADETSNDRPESTADGEMIGPPLGAEGAG